MANLGTPCDTDGPDLQVPSNTTSVPSPTTDQTDGSWHPFQSCAQFELADFLFRRDEMPGG